MPLYEYRCSACQAMTEVIQGSNDDPLTVCESCGGELRKQVSSPAFHLKGSGWYASDYGKPGGKKEESSPEKGSEVKPAEGAATTPAPSPAPAPAPAKDGGGSSNE
jgi:putative FmdB family regulatory protein